MRPTRGCSETADYWRTWVSTARMPDHRCARCHPALGARDQGTHLHADRRNRGRPDDLAARDARRRAKLGLPLHLDARLDLHPPGAPLPQSGLGGQRVHAVRRRTRAERGRCAADHVRDRRAAGPHRVDSRRPLGIRGSVARCGSATAPSTSARTTSSARRSTRSCCTPAGASACRGGCGRSSRRRRSARPQVWRKPDQGIWEARGEPQHYVSSKLMCWVAMDRASKLAEIRGDPELEADVGRRPPRRSRQDILEHGVKDGVLRQHYDTDALDASTLLAAIFGFLPGDDERPAQERAGDRRRPHRGRLRPALPHR